MEKRLTEDQIARIEEARRKTVARNDEEIVRAWQERGLKAPRLGNGQPISFELYKMIVGDIPTSQAAE